tara:strand:+ start:2263 stop:3096 length:834 start_codon:yes stop_codon:yes gene_type:complete
MICYYHKDCMDGFLAAWVVWTVHPDCEFIPVTYKDSPDFNLLKGKDVVIVDFSFPFEDLKVIDSVAKSLLVIDHHQQAYDQELVHMDGDGGGNIIFDAEKSGCVLAWEHYHPNYPPRSILKYAQDRDLWKWELPNSREINAFMAARIFSKPDFQEVNEVNALIAVTPNSAFFAGRTLLFEQEVQIKRIIRNPMSIRIGPTTFVAVNTRYAMSEVCEALIEKYHMPAAAFFQKDPNTWKWSLRGEDVDKSAALYGGGGHPKAAGFYVDRLDHFDLISP